MALREQWEQSGNWLFRYRSYLPLALLPLFALTFALSNDLPNALVHTPLWELGCLSISLLGLAFRAWVVGQVPPGTSGRNTQQQVAAVLNTTGPYSIVRHPLYLANFFTMLGVALWTTLWWFALLFTALFWLYYERIMFAEEEFLRRKFGKAFEQWAQQTPAIIPNFRQYRPAIHPFSVRKVLRQEYPGWVNLPLSFFVLELLYAAFHPTAPVHTLWGYATIGMALVAFLLRWLKYHTQLLQDPIIES